MRPQQPLSRITNEEGEIKRLSKQIGQKAREIQKTCFICRQYQRLAHNIQWWCSRCHMPLCSNSTPRREITCYEEHVANQGDPVLGCSPRASFKLPEQYRLYTTTTTVTPQPHNVPTLPPLATTPLLGDATVALAELDDGMSSVDEEGQIPQQNNLQLQQQEPQQSTQSLDKTDNTKATQVRRSNRTKTDNTKATQVRQSKRTRRPTPAAAV